MSPIQQKPYGWEQRTKYSNPDHHDEDEEDLVPLDVLEVRRKTPTHHRLAVFFTGDENAGKTTFLHSFVQPPMSLTALLPFSNAHFLNVRFCDTTGVLPCETPEEVSEVHPFLDSDICRVSLTLNGVDFHFFLNELGLNAPEVPTNATIELMEFGGDHLNRLLNDPLCPDEIARGSWDLLGRGSDQPLDAFVYMINAQSVNEPHYWERLASRLKFLVLSAKTRKVFFVSRLPVVGPSSETVSVPPPSETVLVPEWLKVAEPMLREQDAEEFEAVCRRLMALEKSTSFIEIADKLKGEEIYALDLLTPDCEGNLVVDSQQSVGLLSYLLAIQRSYVDFPTRLAEFVYRVAPRLRYSLTEEIEKLEWMTSSLLAMALDHFDEEEVHSWDLQQLPKLWQWMETQGLGLTGGRSNIQPFEFTAANVEVTLILSDKTKFVVPKSSTIDAFRFPFNDDAAFQKSLSQFRSHFDLNWRLYREDPSLRQEVNDVEFHANTLDLNEAYRAALDSFFQ